MLLQEVVSETLLQTFFRQHPDLNESSSRVYIQSYAPQVKKIDTLWQLEMLFDLENCDLSLLSDAFYAINSYANKPEVLSPIQFFLLIGGDTARLTPLLAQDPRRFYQVNKDGNNIGHYAAMSGNVTSVKWVSKHFPGLMRDSNCVLTTDIQEYGDNLLHVAFVRGNMAVVKWLTKHHSELGLRQISHRADLSHHAVASGSLQIVEWVKHKHRRLTMLEIDAKGNLPIHIAAKHGYIEILKWFMDQDLSMVKLRSTHMGLNSLDWAAANGHFDCVDLILNAFPDLIYDQHYYQNNAVHAAAAGGSLAMLQYLLKRFPDLWCSTDKFGRNILHHATLSGQLETAIWIHAQYPELINRKAYSGLNIVYFANHSDNKAVITWAKENYPTLLMRLRRWWYGEPKVVAEAIPEVPSAFKQLAKPPKSVDDIKKDVSAEVFSNVDSWRLYPVTTENPFCASFNLR